ncbi:unnamed protein product, partial [Dovyalis caffra]
MKGEWVGLGPTYVRLDYADPSLLRPRRRRWDARAGLVGLARWVEGSPIPTGLMHAWAMRGSSFDMLDMYVIYPHREDAGCWAACRSWSFYLTDFNSSTNWFLLMINRSAD